jgi:hypothetical protein
MQKSTQELIDELQRRMKQNGGDDDIVLFDQENGISPEARAIPASLPENAKQVDTSNILPNLQLTTIPITPSKTELASYTNPQNSIPASLPSGSIQATQTPAQVQSAIPASMPTGMDKVNADRALLDKEYKVNGQVVDKTGSALKNFAKGLGMGALRGLASGGLGGLIGGSLTGGIMNASRGNLDEQDAYDRKAGMLDKESNRLKQDELYHNQIMQQQADLRNKTAQNVAIYGDETRKDRITDNTIDLGGRKQALAENKFDFDTEYKKIKNSIGQQKADDWAKIQNKTLELKSRGLDQNDERIKILNKATEYAKIGKELDNKTKIEVANIMADASKFNTGTKADVEYAKLKDASDKWKSDLKLKQDAELRAAGNDQAKVNEVTQKFALQKQEAKRKIMSDKGLSEDQKFELLKDLE